MITNDIVYINPSGTNERETNEVVQNVQKYFKTKRLNFKHIKLQVDSYNCGVFVCLFFQFLIENKIDFFSASKEINIDNYRNFVKETIQQNSKIEVCCICHSNKTGFTSLFKKKLVTFDCNHKFHDKCLNSNFCLICY